ncbi:tripartite tricarboxylate transporter TctB family protein [Cohnella massiliensis]|nr:tripartite tricarboxylate transporter TctB family protein [Cohnella massiliensis]
MSKTVYRARVITALLFLLLGLVTLWQSQDLKFGSLKSIGPGFFPVVFGGLTAGLSVLMLAGLLKARKQGDASPEKTNEEADEPVRLRGALSFIGIFVLFLVVSHFVGFVAATFASLGVAAYLLGLKGWRLAALTVATTAAVWLIFDLWLGIALPPGIWL